MSLGFRRGPPPEALLEEPMADLNMLAKAKLQGRDAYNAAMDQVLAKHGSMAAFAAKLPPTAGAGYGSTRGLAARTEAPPMLPMQAPAESPMAASIKIQRGDTLGKLAKQHGVSVADLAKWNDIKDPNKIVAGRTLKLGKGYAQGGPVKFADMSDVDLVRLVKVGVPPDMMSQLITELHGRAKKFADGGPVLQDWSWIKPEDAAQLLALPETERLGIPEPVLRQAAAKASPMNAAQTYNLMTRQAQPAPTTPAVGKPDLSQLDVAPALMRPELGAEPPNMRRARELAPQPSTEPEGPNLFWESLKQGRPVLPGEQAPAPTLTPGTSLDKLPLPPEVPPLRSPLAVAASQPPPAAPRSPQPLIPQLSRAPVPPQPQPDIQPPPMRPDVQPPPQPQPQPQSQAQAGGIETLTIEQSPDESPRWSNPLMAAGFALMASKNPNFAQAAGEAGLAGLGQFERDEQGRRQDKRLDREDRRLDQQGELANKAFELQKQGLEIQRQNRLDDIKARLEIAQENREARIADSGQRAADRALDRDIRMQGLEIDRERMKAQIEASKTRVDPTKLIYDAAIDILSKDTMGATSPAQATQKAIDVYLSTQNRGSSQPEPKNQLGLDMNILTGKP